MNPAGQNRVFISHSVEDAAVAREICAAIERRGIPCWIAPRDIRAGDEFLESLDYAIEVAPAFVLVMSRASNRSSFVKSETETAFSYKRPIFPIRVEDVEPAKSMRILVSRWHRVDAFGPSRAAGIRRLAEAVARRVSTGAGGRTIPPGPSVIPPVPTGAWNWKAFGGGLFWLFRHGQRGAGWASLFGLLAFVLVGTILIGGAIAPALLILIGWFAIAALVGAMAARIQSRPGFGEGLPEILVSGLVILAAGSGLVILGQPVDPRAPEVNAASQTVPVAENGPDYSPPREGLVDTDAIEREHQEQLVNAYSDGRNQGQSEVINMILPTYDANAAATTSYTGNTTGM